MIAIVCYGLGNVEAIANIYKRLNTPVTMASEPAHLDGAKKIVVPGVGAFDRAMERLNSSGMRPTLERMVLQEGIPVLGICIGMQMLAHRSDEGSLTGLSWIPGEIKKFELSPMQQPVQLPHMGWNNVEVRSSRGLFENLDDDARFYFLHSYYFSAARNADVLSTTRYCGTFVSSVSSGNIYGVQFHPEKSHQWGVQLLRNFAQL